MVLQLRRFFAWHLWGISLIGPVTSRAHGGALSTAGALAAALAWGFAVEFFVDVWESVGLFTVNKAVHMAACVERVSSSFENARGFGSLESRTLMVVGRTTGLFTVNSLR